MFWKLHQFSVGDDKAYYDFLELKGLPKYQDIVMVSDGCLYKQIGFGNIITL